MESKGLADAYCPKLAAQMRENASGIEEDIVERLGLLVNGSAGSNGWPPDGVRKVIGPTLEYVFRAIEGKGDRQPPPEVIAHACGWAQRAFPIDTLMLHYNACRTVFREHLRKADSSIKSRSQAGFADADRTIDYLFEQLLATVTTAYREEDEWQRSPREARTFHQVERLLSGELIYPPKDLDYDFSATHIGVVGSGPGVDGEIKRLAKMLGGQLLIVQASPNQFWAWIGLKRESSAARLDDVRKAKWDPAVRMGIGEPATRLAGWRCTHCQAKVALPLAIHQDDPAVRYADAALLAATAGNELLLNFFRENYLAPLSSTRDGGEAIRDTLRAYFSKSRQISSAAKVLGVKRHTVRKRLDDVEELLGRTLDSCAAELELALQMTEHMEA